MLLSEVEIKFDFTSSAHLTVVYALNFNPVRARTSAPETFLADASDGTQSNAEKNDNSLALLAARIEKKQEALNAI